MIFIKKVSINFKTIEIIQNKFSDHNGVKLETTNRREFGEYTHVWKLKYIHINNGSKRKSFGGVLENTLR